VRAETCEQCRGYRKIMYQEHDTGVDPVADDLASLALDLLLGEQGYHRASGNPLLWMPNATAAP
jgi:FdhE protein